MEFVTDALFVLTVITGIMTVAGWSLPHIDPQLVFTRDAWPFAIGINETAGTLAAISLGLAWVDHGPNPGTIGGLTALIGFVAISFVAHRHISRLLDTYGSPELN